MGAGGRSAPAEHEPVSAALSRALAWNGGIGGGGETLGLAATGTLDLGRTRRALVWMARASSAAARDLTAGTRWP